MALPSILPHALQLRDPAEIFPAPLPEHYSFLTNPPVKHRVNIKHPGYDKRGEDLFTLYAWDHEEGALCFAFVLDACTAVAGNRAGGYLSTTRGGPAIVAEPNDLLRAGDYFFHVPHPLDSPETEPYRWPVILRFQDYPFPDEIPARWTKNYLSNNGASLTSAQSSVTGAVRVRDQTCRMSKHVTGTQAAHIVPQHEGKWFSQNSMWKYNVDLSLDPDNLLNDMSNLVLLRSDLHVGLDERKFIFYPKGDGSFVVHLLEPTPDLAQLFHNVKMQPGFNCHPSFLFARFVHALLPSLAGFFSMPGLPRNVLLVKATDDGEELVEEEIADPEELRGRISASRSRSPKKRHKAGAPDAKGGVCSQREAEMRPPLRRYVSAASHSQEGGRNSDAECDQPHLAPGARKGSPNPHAGVRLEADPDVLMIKPHITNLFPSWYPGWEDVDKLRQDWLVKERARNQTLKRKRDKKLRSYGVRDVGRHTWQNTRTLCESRFVPLQKGTDRP